MGVAWIILFAWVALDVLIVAAVFAGRFIGPWLIRWVDEYLRAEEIERELQEILNESDRAGAR